LRGLDFELLGYFIVGTFLAVWIGSVALYKFRKIEERYSVATADLGNLTDAPSAPSRVT
jgi:hypothetical protein